MGIIDDVDKLAATEHDIHQIERRIAFLSSLSDANLSKAWPQIANQVGNPSPFAGFDVSRTIIEAPRIRERRLSRSLVLTTAAVLLTGAVLQFSTYFTRATSKLVAKNSSEEQVLEPFGPTLNTDPSATPSGRRELANSVKVSGIRTRSRLESPPLVFKRKQEDRARTLKFVVTGASFVRARPSSQAAILATLEPGTEVEVLDRKGDYIRIRVIRAEGLGGYIHREDAFLKSIG